MGTSVDIDKYQSQGFAIVPGVVSREKIDWLLARFLDLVEEETRIRFRSAHAPEAATFLHNVRAVQTKVYDTIRQPDWLRTFSMQPGMVSAVRDILGHELVLMGKMQFRIDTPLETSEYATWHQDYFYVRGNEHIVTAWVPMQDTPIALGCVSVMPGSHKLGPLPHDTNVIRKRHMPAGVRNEEGRPSSVSLLSIAFVKLERLRSHSFFAASTLFQESAADGSRDGRAHCRPGIEKGARHEKPRSEESERE